MGIPPEWLERFYDFTYYGMLGGFSALVGYLYRTVKHEEILFKWPVAFVTVMIGWYLGMVVAGVIPSAWDQQQRDSMVLLIGATGAKGFEFLVDKISLNKIKKFFD